MLAGETVHRLLTRLRRRSRRLRALPLILMYHRIARPQVDPWGLSVSPGNFRSQLDMLRISRTPLPLSEFVGRLEAGTLPDNAVGITFDDGYRDNLRVAKPLLSAAGIPATVFLATGSLGSRRRFWWDELADLILTRADAADLTIDVGGRALHVAFPASNEAARDDWRAWHGATNERQRFYLSLWKELRSLNDATRSLVMETLRRQLFVRTPDPDECAMSGDDVAELVADGGVAVGAHTVTHPALSMLTDDERRAEIEASVATCQRLVGHEITGFAYPYGDRDEATKRQVRACGIRWACSTRQAAVDRSRFDVFDLPRLQIGNWTAERLGSVIAAQRVEA